VATVHDERHALTVANRQRNVANATPRRHLTQPVSVALGREDSETWYFSLNHKLCDGTSQDDCSELCNVPLRALGLRQYSTIKPARADCRKSNTTYAARAASVRAPRRTRLQNSLRAASERRTLSNDVCSCGICRGLHLINLSPGAWAPVRTDSIAKSLGWYGIDALS
jgi:hypothetical protein